MQPIQDWHPIIEKKKRWPQIGSRYECQIAFRQPERPIGCLFLKKRLKCLPDITIIIDNENGFSLTSWSCCITPSLLSETTICLSHD
jgi:hypothetical protein